MNQGFKSKFDEIRQGNPAEKETQKTENQSFGDVGHVRNLCLIWQDGRKKFLNYAYLVSGEFSPDTSSIILVFTSETVVLKGVNLLELFNGLLSHLPKQIVCMDDRYGVLSEPNKYLVNEISLLI